MSLDGAPQLANVDHNLACGAVDVIHYFDLGIPLIGIVLINANSIDPEVSDSIYRVEVAGAKSQQS
jgi:hypothetical protein